MNSRALEPRPAAYLGVQQVGARPWKIKSYFCASPTWTDAGSAARVRQIAEERVVDLDLHGTSPDFTYFGFGFFICHFGRRGTTASLFHYGLWIDMPEVFAASWYSFGHEAKTFERLDLREPLLCLHEIPVAAQEVAIFREVVFAARDESRVDWLAIADEYLARQPGRDTEGAGE